MNELTKEIIDKCFESCTNQHQYWRNLYGIAFKNWDNIKNIEGFPKVSEKTNEYLFHKCIVFDQKYHPNVLNGGLWVNKGFGTDFDLKEDWVVDISKVKVFLNVIVNCRRCGEEYYNTELINGMCRCCDAELNS